MFGDNDQDKFRNATITKRQYWGGQAAVAGKWDRSVCFGIITSFVERNQPQTLKEFEELLNPQFEQLKQLINRGCDIIVPASELLKPKEIIHTLGTGIAKLKVSFLKKIQERLEELCWYASKEIQISNCVAYDNNQQPTFNKYNNNQQTTCNNMESEWNNE